MSPSAFVPALGCRAGLLNRSPSSVALISTTHLSHRPSFRPRCTLKTPTPQAPLPPRPTQRIPVLSPTYSAPTPPPPAPAAVVIIPGYGSPYTDYLPLQSTLQAALPSALVRTVPVTTLTWARTLGGRPVTPVLDLIAAAVASARLDAPASPITLVAHSAAGWIARIFISTSAQYFGTTYAGARNVDRLVCLGTPQRSAEKITMANMAFVNTECADCEKTVEYICVGGTAVAFDGPGGGSWRFWETGWISRVSYGITAGKGALEGDGIVPTECFYLDGAMNVELEGVWHAPKSPGPWYGDERAVAYWSTLIRG